MALGLGPELGLPDGPAEEGDKNTYHLTLNGVTFVSDLDIPGNPLVGVLAEGQKVTVTALEDASKQYTLAFAPDGIIQDNAVETRILTLGEKYSFDLPGTFSVTWCYVPADLD